MGVGGREAKAFADGDRIMKNSRKPKNTLRQLQENLSRDDAAFDMALRALEVAEGSRDESQKKAAHKKEARTSDAADTAWRAFCGFKPATAEELIEYLGVTLTHERIRRNTEISPNDGEFVLAILRNSHTAIARLLMPTPLSPLSPQGKRGC